MFNLFGRQGFLEWLVKGTVSTPELPAKYPPSLADASDEEVQAAIYNVPAHYAPPSPAAIGTPAGLHLRDGYSSKIVFNRLNTFSLWEKSVQPPALSVGEAIDLTTMRNTSVTTKWPQTLHDIGDITLVCAYDPNAWAQARATLLGQNDNITIQFPDGTTLAFFGFLRELSPAALQRGTFPECNVVITVTNLDSSWAEQPPVLTNVAGS